MSDTKHECVDCGRNLLSFNAWISTPAGGLCLDCEAGRARRARTARLLDRSHLGRMFPETFDEAGNARARATDGECDRCGEAIDEGEAKELNDERLCYRCFIPAALAVLDAGKRARQ